jgi:hypothetical protein
LSTTIILTSDMIAHLLIAQVTLLVKANSPLGTLDQMTQYLSVIFQ